MAWCNKNCRTECIIWVKCSIFQYFHIGFILVWPTLQQHWMRKYSQNRIYFFIYVSWTQIFRKSLCKISKLFIFVIKIHYFDHIFLVYKDVYWHLKFFCTFPFGFISVWAYIVPQGLRIFYLKFFRRNIIVYIEYTELFFFFYFFLAIKPILLIWDSDNGIRSVTNVFLILINTFMCMIRNILQNLRISRIRHFQSRKTQFSVYDFLLISSFKLRVRISPLNSFEHRTQY